MWTWDSNRTDFSQTCWTFDGNEDDCVQQYAPSSNGVGSGGSAKGTVTNYNRKPKSTRRIWKSKRKIK